MKIAIATENGFVAQHFGHCAVFTLVELENNEVVRKELVDNPGHRPGFLPGFLAKHGVSCIIAGGMGQWAQDLFTEQNIETIIGVTGSVEQVIADYLAGSLQPGESLCDHRHGGHHCSEEQ